MLVRHYKIKYSAFIPQNYDYFLIIIPWHTDLFIPPWQEFKNCHSRNKAFAFAAIHEVPFEPPHCCGIGDILCIASGFQSYLSCIHMQMLIIPKGADQHCKVFLCLECGYQEVHTGNDTFTAVRMAKRAYKPFPQICIY
jgi:hypothetical protein